jgi:pectate lyase
VVACVRPVAISLATAACLVAGGLPASPGAPTPAATASSPSDEGDLRAFPGAEGFGALVSGGRGGQVIKVTTLRPTGPGSLQEALDTPGPRIIVFAVSGVIADSSGANVQLTISEGDVTIAGQTAPGAGITIRGQLFTDYSNPPSNIVVRHLRVRPVYDGSDPAQFDAIQFGRAQGFILDHVSVSGGADETVDLYYATDATVQWSAIESPAQVVLEGDTMPEGKGLINGPDGTRVSVHHTLFAHNNKRTPAIATGPAEVVNNVIYNARRGFVHNNPAAGPFNIIGNTYIAGPSVDDAASFYFDADVGTNLGTLSYYLSGNEFEGTGACAEGPTDDPWTTCAMDHTVGPSTRATDEHKFTGDRYVSVTATSAAEARPTVLAAAGAFPRDFITARSVEETNAGTGDYDPRYDNDSDFLAGLTPTDPPPDADEDGIDDDWEAAHGLSPADPSDAATTHPGGYPAIETYLNDLATTIAG